MISKDSAEFYFDTYALIERQRGTPSYASFQEVAIFSHEFNIAEFSTWATREEGKEGGRARSWQMHDRSNLLPATVDDYVEAAMFRRGRMSFVDALGYVLAKRHGKRFLTGDPEFQALENVEFVV